MSKVPDFLQLVPSQPHLKTLHREAIEHAKPGGLFCEFGVGHGTSLTMLRDIVPVSETIYGFDSFKGLPEPWNGLPKGACASAAYTSLPNVKLLEGWFIDTLGEFAERHAGEFIRYAHIDCDLYSSTATVLAELNLLIVSGTVIVFDELFGYESWQEHEHRALVEWAEECSRAYAYILRDEHQRAAIVVLK